MRRWGDEMSELIDRQNTLQAIIKRLGIKNESYLLESERALYQQILAMPTVKAIPVESLEMLLKGMRISIGSQSKEIESIYGQGTGWRDYSVGYISAISFIEGWLVEQKDKNNNK